MIGRIRSEIIRNGGQKKHNTGVGMAGRRAGGGGGGGGRGGGVAGGRGGGFGGKKQQDSFLARSSYSDVPEKLLEIEYFRKSFGGAAVGDHLVDAIVDDAKDSDEEEDFELKDKVWRSPAQHAFIENKFKEKIAKSKSKGSKNVKKSIYRPPSAKESREYNAFAARKLIPGENVNATIQTLKDPDKSWAKTTTAGKQSRDNFDSWLKAVATALHKTQSEDEEAIFNQI